MKQKRRQKVSPYLHLKSSTSVEFSADCNRGEEEENCLDLTKAPEMIGPPAPALSTKWKVLYFSSRWQQLVYAMPRLKSSVYKNSYILLHTSFFSGFDFVSIFCIKKTKEQTKGKAISCCSEFQEIQRKKSLFCNCTLKSSIMKYTCNINMSM